MPAGVECTPEQRIVERAQPLPGGGAITGWANLRLRRAAYFDGRGLLVGVVVPADCHPRNREGVRWVRRGVPDDLEVVLGLRLLPATEALIDHMAELVRRGRPREATVAADMCVAASLCTLAEVGDALQRRRRIASRPRVERALGLAREGSLSPPESQLRLLWMLDTAIPEPVVNRWVVDDEGRLVAVPDLLEPKSGLVVEYDGSAHAGARRRSRDAEKDDLYRELGLEPMRLTAPDMQRPLSVIDRLERGYRRAVTSDRPRRWSIGQPFAGTHGTVGDARGCRTYR